MYQSHINGEAEDVCFQIYESKCDRKTNSIFNPLDAPTNADYIYRFRSPPHNMSKAFDAERTSSRRTAEQSNNACVKKILSRQILKSDFYFTREHNLQSLCAIEVPASAAWTFVKTSTDLDDCG